MTDRRAEISEAALQVAAARGLGAMSMRAVAEQAGSSVMALYRHVPTKEALLDDLVGRLLAEVALPDPAQPWRQRLQHLAAELYALATRYPTVVPLLLTRSYQAPEAVRLVDATADVLRDAGVPAGEVPRLERMASTFLLGYVTSAANHAFWSDPAATTPPTAAPIGARPDHDAADDHWRTELRHDVSDLADLLHRLAHASEQGGP